jgi:subtilisin family serine protease
MKPIKQYSQIDYPFLFLAYILIISLIAFTNVWAKNNASHSGDVTSQNSQKAINDVVMSQRTVYPGMIVVKLKEPSLRPAEGQLSLDRLEQQHQVYSVEPAFSFIQSTKKVDRVGLNRIYYYRYADGSDPVVVAEEFHQDLNVEVAEPKYIYPLNDVPNDPQYGVMSQFPQVQAENAWTTVKAEQGNVIVAIVDGGTDWDHEDLAANIWNNSDEIANNGIDDDNNGFIDDIRGWNFANNSNDPTGLPGTPSSAGHGTHTAGTAASVSNNNVGVASMSWNAVLMPINAAHPTSDRSILYGYDGIAYAAANGADIVNCSWGGLGSPSSIEQDIIDFAYENGTLVVASAGNNGLNNDVSSHYPSSYNHVLSVGATNKTNDSKASFSNYGVSIDVFAPGVNILSTTPNNGYSSFYSGTSMSGPMVAGLAALVKTQNPSWSVDQVREQIRVTSDNIDGSNPTYTGLMGKGRINARRAVTEFTNPAIRMVSKSFIDSGGDGIINAGETVDAQIKFTNYLASTGNVALTFSENDNNITITNGTSNVGTFNTGDTVTIAMQFQVGSGVPDGYVLRFKVDISDGSYSDRDAFDFVVNPPQFRIHDTGLVQTAITTQGNIGWTGFAGTPGSGFVYSGQNFLFEGGLMIGTAANTLSDCIRGSDGQTQDDDFEPAAEEVLSLISPGQFSLEEGSILLVDSLAPTPLGLRIQQRSYADTVSGNNGGIIFEYEILNPTPNPISNLFVGLFFDWDINSTAADYARYDGSRKMGIVQNASSSPTRLAASRLLSNNATVSYRAIDNPAEIYDGFSDFEKWNFLSGGLQTQTLDDVDISTVLSEGPINLPAGGTVTVAFAVVGGNSQSELESNSDNLLNLWNSGGTAIEPIHNRGIPQKYELAQNYPNPFNPTTTISFQMPEAGNVSLKIFNIVGQVVRDLESGYLSPGSYQTVWDATDNFGNPVASGIYFYQLSVQGEANLTLTRKMMMMK